ncbi:MAG TPA: prepilin-type N-terminal cleavage/methylation domain-containing protein [Terriglobia bacterium]|jgi:type IV pilus assembly protein PilA|nr:prepilin-type N-terminal cleavage/methylation domain-containing protein [Terriglobia bacterium]
MKRHTEGFSLIELLIVVAIILIIAAIAIPNLLKSKAAANGASAVASLRTLNTVEITFSSEFNQGFTTTLLQLGPPSSGNATSNAAGLIDSILAAGAKAGYNFVYAASAAVNGQVQNYTINANPQQVGVSGTIYYYTDPTNTIRQNSAQQAAATDSPIGG